jgi:RNA polymerase sigma-70 factor (ECF subfamily)
LKVAIVAREEKEAIRKLQQGDLDGLAWLSQTYFDQAIRVAYLITHNTSLAEDVVQDAFVKLCKTIWQFNSLRNFSPWFMRSVANAAINACRQDWRAEDLEEDEFFIAERLSVDLQELPEEQLIQNEQQQEISDALEKLHPRQRAVIVLRYYLDMSENEMAQVMKSSRATVKSLLFSARQNLQKRLISGSQEAGQDGTQHRVKGGSHE